MLLVSLLLVSLIGATPAPAVPAITTPSDAPLCSDIQLVANRGGSQEAHCTAVADCGSYGSVSCSGSSTCKAVDKNCPAGKRGHVVCDGIRTKCPKCCTNNTYQEVPTGDCCPYPEFGEETLVEKCVNGDWVTQFTRCEWTPQCPLIP